MTNEQYQARIDAQQEVIQVLGRELAERAMALRVQRAAMEKLREKLAGLDAKPRFNQVRPQLENAMNDEIKIPEGFTRWSAEPDGRIVNIWRALDSTLGDTDPDFGDMSDEEIRDESPVWWATRELRALIDAPPAAVSQAGALTMSGSAGTPRRRSGEMTRAAPLIQCPRCPALMPPGLSCKGNPPDDPCPLRPA